MSDASVLRTAGKAALVHHAIVPAGHNSKLRLLGISTVAGNQTVDKVTLNALGVVAAAGLQHISMFILLCVLHAQLSITSSWPADVYKGQSRPLMRPLVS